MPQTRESSAPKMRKSLAAAKYPERAEIALRAYHLYLERGGAPGNELDDWTRAERELLEPNGKPSRKAIAKSKPA
jgi:hypothetical protein